MTDIEVLLTDLGEIATRDIARSEHPKGLKENLKVAKKGGEVQKMPESLMKMQQRNLQFLKTMHSIINMPTNNKK